MSEIRSTDRLEPVSRRTARQRHRAVWMYYVEGMTQNAIADVLGVGRVTVVRMLAEAKALYEVKISLRGDLEKFPRLEIALEKRFGLKEAIVTPLSSAEVDPSAAIGAAAGLYISDLVKSGSRIGVGWGRTLLNTLNFIDESQATGVEVVSLLGGISAIKQYNPAEFAWRFSRIFDADCYLIPAPAVVDSEATKRSLIDRCGLGAVFAMAQALDVALLSVGSMATTSTAQLFDVISPRERLDLIAAGAVGDLLYNFFDREGRIVDHPLNSRIMSVAPAALKRTPMKVLMSGGADKTEAVLGGLRLVEPHVLITDEITAKILLDTVGAEAPSAVEDIPSSTG